MYNDKGFLTLAVVSRIYFSYLFIFYSGCKNFGSRDAGVGGSAAAKTAQKKFNIIVLLAKRRKISVILTFFRLTFSLTMMSFFFSYIYFVFYFKLYSFLFPFCFFLRFYFALQLSGNVG